jgi:hypothetical protein
MTTPKSTANRKSGAQHKTANRSPSIDIAVRNLTPEMKKKLDKILQDISLTRNEKIHLKDVMALVEYLSFFGII